MSRPDDSPMASRRRRRPRATAVVVVTCEARERVATFGQLDLELAPRVVYFSSVVRAANAEVLGGATTLVVGPSVSMEDVQRLLEARDQHSPGLPIVAVRAEGEATPPEWALARVGVLRCPVQPEQVARCVALIESLTFAVPPRLHH